MSKTMKPMPLTRLTLLLLALAGCNVLPTQEGSGGPRAAPLAAPPTAPAEPALPAVALTPALMYQLLLSELAVQQGELALAAELIADAASSSRDPRLAQRATQMAMISKQFPLARRSAELWLALNPEAIAARQALVVLLLRDGDEAAALAQLRQLLPRLDPQRGVMQIAALLTQQPAQRSLNLLRQLLGDRQDRDARYAYAHLAHRLGEQEQAATTLGELLRQQPNDSAALQLLAAVQQRRGDNDSAIITLQRLLQLQPNDADARLRLAKLLVATEQLPAARQQFQTLLQQRPDSADIHYALGLLALEAADAATAKPHFERLLELNQHRNESLFALGQIAELAQQWQVAIDHYSAIDESEGDRQRRAQLRIAAIIDQQEGLEAALNYLDQLPLIGVDETIHRELAAAELLQQHQQPTAALARYDSALQLHPDQPDLLYARAMLAAQLQRFDALERDLKRLIQLQPDHAQALNALGYTLADRNRQLDDAARYIEHAYSLQPEEPAILDSMGWLRYRQGRLQEAVSYLQQALALQQDGEIAAHLGEVLWQMGERAAAEQVWQEALRHAPEHTILRATMQRLRP